MRQYKIPSKLYDTISICGSDRLYLTRSDHEILIAKDYVKFNNRKGKNVKHIPKERTLDRYQLIKYINYCNDEIKQLQFFKLPKNQSGFIAMVVGKISIMLYKDTGYKLIITKSSISLESLHCSPAGNITNVSEWSGSS